MPDRPTTASDAPVPARSRIGIRAALLVPSTYILAASGVAVTALATSRFEQLARAELESKGRAIALDIARSAQETASSRRVAALTDAVDECKSTAGLAYIFVVDESDAVLVHAFAAGFPEREWHVKNPVPPGDKLRVAEVELTEKEGLGPGPRVLDVAAAILSGERSTVHVGLDLEALAAQVAALRLASLGVVLATLVAGTALLAWIVRGIARPIEALRRTGSRIVDEGDLSPPPPIESGPELAELAAVFGRLVIRLRAIAELRRSARTLTEAAADLGRQTHEQSQTGIRQAAALHETHVTAQEVKETSNVAVKKAEGVIAVADRALALGRAGEEAIDQSVSGLTQIRGQVEEIAARIVHLGERARQIQGITETVKALADQSNMLALNAAIEAVRSGEHGKGFAVVAREIRSLADQSIEATNRVREILEDIAGAIDGAVTSTQTGVERIEGGLSQARALGDSLRQVSAIVLENSGAVRQIATAVEQQNAGIAQMFNAVAEQAKLMDETRRRLEETERAASVLREASQSVARVADTYRV